VRRLTAADLPIRTRRLVLRDFEPGDLAALGRVARKGRVPGELPLGGRALAVAERVAARGRSRLVRARRSFELAVVLRRGAKPIGACDLATSGRRRADIGYVLARRHWGYGYGSEVAVALVDFAFAVLGLDAVTAIVAVGNERSRRVLDKAGLHWDGLMRRHARFAGRWWDCHRYIIERSDWSRERRLRRPA
jgi:RimJ/RimL family protein N-acetyltransferase